MFENKTIERMILSSYFIIGIGQLSQKMRFLIMDHLAKDGLCHRVEDGVYKVMDKTIEDWANIIHKTVSTLKPL